MTAMNIDFRKLKSDPVAKSFKFTFKTQMERIRLEKVAKHLHVSMADVIHFLLEHLPDNLEELEVHKDGI